MYSKNIYVSESSMNYSDANLSESDVDSPLYNNTPIKGSRNNSIDYSKFKTKVCRNYMLGLRCPFEDRCAFSHGPIPRSNSASVAAPPPPPSYADSVNESAIADADADAPPTYENFLTTESPDCSQPPSPPQYPSKYRYDPYSCQGVIFEN
ncbi:zinc finger protein, putative [Bodo saltans]|uniref:Zinc finger protein, putative n=1 Tax=Bodo saltans TaxID=75058 RepID=A0A0S4IQW8_BODSA|nr:zinc finger protein, putative [Bodo saltans]|eukprot:CUF25055.1 zinc finger protein, putative [Bodo saltans]